MVMKRKSLIYLIEVTAWAVFTVHVFIFKSINGNVLYPNNKLKFQQSYKVL